MLDVTGAETVIEGNLREPQVRSSETAQYLGLDGFQASRCKAAMTGNMGGIAVRAETKPDQIEQMLGDRVIGGGIELRSEPMRRLDLLQNKVRKLVAGIDATRNLVVNAPAKLAEQFLRDSNAPPIPLGEVSHLRRLIGAQQNHLPER
jgi:hypothetical protein